MNKSYSPRRARNTKTVATLDPSSSDPAAIRSATDCVLGIVVAYSHKSDQASDQPFPM